MVSAYLLSYIHVDQQFSLCNSAIHRIFIGSQVCTNASIALVNNGSQFFWCPLKRADESAETEGTECCGEPDQQVCCPESDYVSAFVVESSAPSLSPQWVHYLWMWLVYLGMVMWSHYLSRLFCPLKIAHNVILICLSNAVVLSSLANSTQKFTNWLICQDKSF